MWGLDINFTVALASIRGEDLLLHSALFTLGGGFSLLPADGTADSRRILQAGTALTGGTAAALTAVATATVAAAAAATTIPAATAALTAAFLAAGRRYSGADHNTAVGFHTGGRAGSALDGGNRAMDDAALIGVHRLQRDAAAGAHSLVGQLAGQGLQGTGALFTVIAAIDGKADILALTAVGYQTGQVLDGIQGLAPAADDAARFAHLPAAGGHFPRSSGESG